MEIAFTEEEYFQKIGRISASSHEKPLQKYQTRDRMDEEISTKTESDKLLVKLAQKLVTIKAK